MKVFLGFSSLCLASFLRLERGDEERWVCGLMTSRGNKSEQHEEKWGDISLSNLKVFSTLLTYEQPRRILRLIREFRNMDLLCFVCTMKNCHVQAAHIFFFLSWTLECFDWCRCLLVCSTTTSSHSHGTHNKMNPHIMSMRFKAE